MAKGFQLFVNRLSFYTTNEKLKKLFSPFGVVTEARLVKDPRTQRPKGFGFVTFESEADAYNALNSMNRRLVEAEAEVIGWDMAEPPSLPLKENKIAKGIFAVVGIMSTLVIYGILQEKIMRVPYGPNKEFFSYSLFLVFCNRITTSAVSAGVLLASKKALDPVAPLYKYGVVSVSNILTTTCQYEALKYVSFPVQTLAKCAKMIPVMIWGAIIMQKKYQGQDYLFAFLVTLGCSLFILYQDTGDISPFNRGRESTVWGVSLMIGYLGFDGFTSTFQDKLFKGYDMEIHNQIFYTTVCSCLLSFIGLILQGSLLMAIDFVTRHHDCFFDIALLSTVATASQFFISYTIRTFGALTFATIMTTRQLVSILLSCLWFGHPLSWEQCSGAVIVFGSLYARSFLKTKQKAAPSLEMAETKIPGPQ